MIKKGDGLAVWRSADDHTIRAPPVGRVEVVNVLGPSEATAQNTLNFQPNAQFVCKAVKSRHTPDLLLYVDPSKTHLPG